VRQSPGGGVPRAAHLTAPSAPLISVDDPALKDRPVRFQELPDDLQTQAIQPNERGHIGVSKSRISHVEVFRDGQCENFHPRRTSTPIRTPTR